MNVSGLQMGLLITDVFINMKETGEERRQCPVVTISDKHVCKTNQIIWRRIKCILFYFYSVLSHNLERTLGHRKWIRNNPFPAALVELAKSIPVHSLILSSHLFFCLPPLLFPFTVPCRIVFPKTEDLESWPNHLSFLIITSGSNSSQRPAFFSLTLQSKFMIHRHTEIWK